MAGLLVVVAGSVCGPAAVDLELQRVVPRESRIRRIRQRPGRGVEVGHRTVRRLRHERIGQRRRRRAIRVTARPAERDLCALALSRRDGRRVGERPEIDRRIGRTRVGADRDGERLSRLLAGHGIRGGHGDRRRLPGLCLRGVQQQRAAGVGVRQRDGREDRVERRLRVLLQCGVYITGIWVSFARVVWSDASLFDVGFGIIWPKIVYL